MHMALHIGMNFARAQLEKYGWTEGKGLGVNESGITEALKPKLKFDTSGIGHDAAEQFTYHWWENAYNQAAENLEVCRNEDGVAVKVHDVSFDISTRKYLAKSCRAGSTLLYGNFLKTSTLTGDGHIVQECEEELSRPIQSIPAITLTDEELLKACGGLTAHKGARHGLTLSGKLSRIQEQEQKLLGSMKDRENVVEFVTGDDHRNEKMKKKTKKMNEESAGIEDLATTGGIEPQRKKKKKKKETCDISESNIDGHENNAGVSNVGQSAEFEDLGIDGGIEPQRRKRKKKKKKEACELSEFNIDSRENNEGVSNVDESAVFEDLRIEGSIEPQRKKKKKNKEACELPEFNIDSRENNEAVSNVDENSKVEDLATGGSSERKKGKKSKEASVSDKNENMEASDVEEHRRKKHKESDELTFKSRKKKKDAHSLVLNGKSELNGASSVSDDIPEESGHTKMKFRKNEEQCTEMENEARASDDISNNTSDATKKRPPLTWRQTPEGWICCGCAAIEVADLNNSLSNGDVRSPQKKKKKGNRDNVLSSSVERNTVDQPDSIFDGSSTYDHISQKKKHKSTKFHSGELPPSRESVDLTSKEEKKKKKKKKKYKQVEDSEQSNVECLVDTTLEHSIEDSVLLGNTSEVRDKSSKRKKQKEKHLENGDDANVLENISGVSSKKEKKKKKRELENADSTVPRNIVTLLGE